MKSRTKVFSAFLVIATVETLSLFIRAGVARGEPLLSEQNFGNYIASLPIELSQEQPSEAEQRFHNFLIASLDSALEAQTSSSEQTFGNYVAALPIELNQAQPSEAEQRFRNFLIASLDSTLEAQTSSSEQTFGNYVAALPIEANQAQPSETEQQLAFLPLEANQVQAAETEQRFSSFLVASLDSALEVQTSATESNFGNYVAALPIEADQAQPSETEQQVAFLPQPGNRSRSTVERNYIYDVPQADTNLSQPKKEELSAAVQNYADYLVALRAQQSNEQSQSQAEPGTETTNAPISTGLKILSPQQNAVLDVPAATITVQYPLGSQVELRANGVLVNSSLIGGTETNSSTKVVTQTWYGVVFHEGDNIITAQTKTNGGAGQSTSVKVQVRGSAQQLKIQTVEARIPADGRSTAKIQGQLLDKNGNRSNRDAIVTLAASAGEFVGADADEDEPGFQLQAREGQFTATLRSDLKAQTVRIRATTGKLEAFTQLQFETNLRSSIVTGVVDVRLGRRGTDFYKSFRDFLPPDKDNRTELDFHTSVFATGKIGEWLFTGAYNSDRNLNQNCDGTTSVFRQDNQFCDRNYPVYGDSSKVENLTPSQDSLYLRFERNSRIPNAEPDYAMWGDYNTQEFSRKSQEFTATNRNLHGFKANYNLGKLQITGLYGDNVQGFQRDTIAPDGTGGYYFLSRRLLIPGSENVAIELEELNRPGTVLDRKQLSRGPDYEIDYDRGTLLFRNPLLRTDIDKFGQVLVRRIVITYQYENQDNDNNFYGGRLQYNFSRELNSESWLGATYIKENQGVRDFELYGADAYISVSSKSHLIAEYAHSKNDSEMMGQVSGSAFRLEAEGEIAKGIQGRAYLRSADSGFANNATISFVPGQTRYGAQITGNVSPTTNVRLQYDHEENKGIAPQPLDTFEDFFAPRSEAVPGSRVDNSLTTITAGVQQRIGKADLTVDLIHRSREDRIQPEALSGNSDQLRSRLNVPITDNLSFLAQNELSFSSDQDAIYPDRTILGLDWKVASDLSIRLAQQFYTGGQYEGNSITSLDFIGEHKFGKDTTMTGRYSILGGADGISTQGAIGINQGFTISPGLKLSLAYEHVFGDFYGRTAAGTQFAQPFAVGQSAASLGFGSGDSYSIGLDYKDNPNFQASARYEHRNSSGGSNTLISAGVTGKISPALTALLRYQQASSSNQKLEGLGDTANLKLGLAYRDPNNDKFNALLRYEYRKNPSTIPDSLLLGTGTGSEDHTFALETLYAPNWRWELYGKYAIRHSTSYLAQDLVGSSTINLAQLRATYRLGYKFDLVGEARWLDQPSTNHSETGFVIEGGYYLTPNLRLSAGYAFGSVNDEDFSGSRSAGGLYAGLTVKLNELFDGFGLQKPAPAQQQESKVKPVASKATEQQKLKERLAHHAPAQPVQQQNATPATTDGQKLKERLRQVPVQPVQQNAMPATSTPAVAPDAPGQSVEPATPAPAFTIAPETIPDQLGEPAIPPPTVAPENTPAQLGETS